MMTNGATRSNSQVGFGTSAVKISKLAAAKLLHDAHRASKIAQGVDGDTLPLWASQTTAEKNLELARVSTRLLTGVNPTDAAFPDISAVDDVFLLIWPAIMTALGG